MPASVALESCELSTSMASSTQFFRRFKKKLSSERSRRSEVEENVAPFFGDPRFEKPVWENKPKRKAKNAKEQGEQVLLTFIRAKLGNRAEHLAIRLMNKSPLKEGKEFTYSINQSTEGNYFLSSFTKTTN